MRFLLQAAGHETVSAPNGERGLECVARDAPDLIVCDIQMPVLDGFGVVRRLRGLDGRKDTPCVAVTALAMPDDRKRALSEGFDGYISKPIEPERFAEELESYLRPRSAPAITPPLRNEKA